MASLPKTIFHVDMDAFFVSVEELFDPSLKGKAVVVGGPRDARGVVAAASYEARKFGVHSAMPLRTAAKLCPQAIFVEGHPERYREYSEKVYQVLMSFSPQVEMASVDEAYLDMTGTERLHGPPLRAAHTLHNKMKSETQLNCSVGIGASRLVAKISSAKAKPNGILWAIPGEEAKLLAPLDVGDIPGVGKVTEKNLHALGIRKIGDLARFEESFLQERFGKWGLALAGKARGEDAGGWFDSEVGADSDAKSISHEHTYMEDTADAEQIESTLMRLSEMVGRRLREGGYHARTLQLKLRYQDFYDDHSGAYCFPRPRNWIQKSLSRCECYSAKTGAKARACACWGSRLHRSRTTAGQGDLLEDGRRQRWQQALSAADRLRDRFGESSVTLASGLKGGFRERTHENPVGLPGKGIKGR